MIAPFPWHALPRVSPAHVRAAGRVRRAFPRAKVASFAESLGRVLGHRVEIDVRRVQTAARVDLGTRGPVVVLDAPGASRSASSSRLVAIEVEAELALGVVSSLAGGKLPRIARERRVDPEVAGAMAGVLAWLAREHVDDGFSVTAVGHAPFDVAAHLGLDLLTLDLVVRVGALRSAARLAVAVPELDGTPALSAAETLASLDQTLLGLEVVAASGVAPAKDLARLAVGDLVVVDRTHGLVLSPARGEAGTSVEAASPDLDGAQRVRLRGDRVQLAAAATRADVGLPMPPDDATSATLQLPAASAAFAEDLAELPLGVRIELGSITLTARAWASVAPGDVLVLDRRVGDPVTLRVGDRAVARGELVEVDGALGVRITERSA